MNDDLDQKTDAELNDLFAVEVADMQRRHAGSSWFHHRGSTECGPAPQFTTDANAVLPWLEKQQYRNAYGRDGGWQIAVGYSCGLHYHHYATAPTFARAAVIALLRAKRSSK